VIALVSAALALSHVDASVTLQVSDREAAVKQVITSAEQAGGWFSSLSEDSVVVRVPVDQAAAFVESSRGLGRMVDRRWSAQDLDASLLDLRARLASREAVLTRYLGILDTATASSVVAVEREITSTVAEIEGLQGRIRYLEHQGAYAQLAFGFQFRDRAAPARDGSSSFAWLNSLNLADLQDAFRSDRFDHRSAGVTLVAPEGFAAGRKAGRFHALSPDDVMLRVRVEKNKPEADLAFWREAMTVRMTEAGYHVVATGDVTAGGTPGALLELSAPDGASDATYLVALFVDGKRLVLVEAAGEVSRVAKCRGVILASIQGMSL
jgi:hypothetical protein